MVCSKNGKRLLLGHFDLVAKPVPKQAGSAHNVLAVSSLVRTPAIGDRSALVNTGMTPQIRLDGLLFSNDTQVLGVMSQVLRNFAIETETVGELGSALDAVVHRRLDAIIVDWEDVQDPTRIVRSARKSSPNGNSTIVALVNAGSETHALLVGANFMIHKPADLEHADRCMRAAYGTMLQNRRRAARVAVNIPVKARVAEVGVINARISDLSIGGVALQCEQPLQINCEVLTNFTLPNTNHLIHVTGKVVNANAGRAGMRFSYVAEEDLETLETWLAVELAKLEKAEMPAEYAQNFSD